MLCYMITGCHFQFGGRDRGEIVGYLKRSIPSGIGVLCAPIPPDDSCFTSQHLLILCNNSDTPWVDPAPHIHQESDEAYMVLEGAITLSIEQEEVVVASGEICFVPAGDAHSVIDVQVPYRGFVIRAPASADKVYIS